MDSDPIERTLRTLDRSIAPSPVFAAALERRLLAELGRDRAANGRADHADHLGLVASPNGRAAARVPFSPATKGAHRWLPVGQVATAAVLALTLLGGYVAYALLRPVPNVSAPTGGPAFEVLVADTPGSLPTRLDPATLEDLAAPPTLGAGVSNTPWTFSRDGSTRIEIRRVVDRGAHVSDIIVGDARSGSERLRIRSQVPVTTPLLSDDGTRLVVTTEFGTLDLPHGWLAYDTTSGRLLATVADDEGDDLERWIDPSARRLYTLVLPQPMHDVDPRLAQIIVNELATGAEVGRVTLPDVRVGISRVDTAAAAALGRPDARLTPGAAFSPDGRRLVVVHADRDAMTFIDTKRLEVERTLEVTRPRSTLDRIVAWLTFAPESAAAKDVPARESRPVFGADGRYLYVSYVETTFGAGGAMQRGRGVRAIDVESGEIVAEALADTLFDHVVPTPDGHGVYVAGPRQGGNLGTQELAGPYLLRRLDADTLAVLAEREFPAPIGLIVRTGATPTPEPDAATPEDTAALLARCPGSAATQIPGVTDFINVGLGRAPIWLAGWGSPPGTPVAGPTEPTVPGLTFQPGAAYVAPYGWAHRALWVIAPGFAEPVTLSGRSLDDGSPVWFEVVGFEATTESVLDPAYPAIPLQHGDWSQTPPALWAEFPSGLYFPTSGCYELVATWKGGSWRATIPYMAPAEMPEVATPRP